MEKKPSNLKTIIKENKYILLFLGLVASITYGFEIANWTMTVDEEIWSHVDKFTFAKGWIGDGRWGIALLKIILPTHKVLPFFNGILAIVFLVSSAFLLGVIFQEFVKSKVMISIIVALFLTMPIHSYYLMFDTFSVEMSIGIFCALLAAYKLFVAAITNNKRKMIESLIIMTFSISIYQSNFMIYTCFICGLLLLAVTTEIRNGEIEDNRKYINVIWMSVLNLIISVGIYEIVKIILQNRFGASDYINGYFRWSYIDKETCLQQVKVYLTFLFCTPGDLIYGGQWLLLFYVLSLIAFIMIFIKGKNRRTIILLAFIGLNLSLCIEYIIMGGNIPLRTLPVLAVYISIICCWIFVIIDKKILNQLMAFVMLLVTLYQASDVTELFYSEYSRQEYDLAFLNRVIIKVEELNKGEVPEEPVVFVGGHSWNSVYSIDTEQFDDSMFNLGQSGRVYRYLMDLGYNYNIPTDEMIARAGEIANNMPIWPYEGSVVCEDGMIIVNLGE